MNGTIIDVASQLPDTSGAPLDHSCLHCQLALPIQHFIERHPEATREQLIDQMCEVIAEMVSSCGTNWKELRPYRKLAAERLEHWLLEKFKAHDERRRAAHG